MSCAVCISCLVVVAILGGVSSIPEQQLEVENPTENRDIRSTVIDNNFESRAIKCGNRMRACANAGGKCQSKKDVCEGKLLTGKIYCRYSKTCGCCVPPPPKKGCVFGSTVYSHETYIEDSCMSLQCKDGSWIYTGSISNACGECQVHGDPHFITYEPHKINGDIIIQYAYQGEGDYVISQQGLDIRDALFRVTANFIECYAADITCVNSVSYTEPDIEVSFILPSLEHNDHCIFNKDPANDPLCKIKVLVNRRERSIDNTVHSFYGTDGTVLVFNHNHIKTDANLNCMNLVGSKGFSVSLCQHAWDYAYLYVWALPSLANQLYGLCDTFSGLDLLPPIWYPIGYTAQNGSLIQRRANRPPTSFADSWKIGENPPSNVTLPPADKCDSSKIKNEIAKECKEITKDACAIEDRNCKAYISACIFDLCHVPNHDSYALGYESHMLVNSQISVSSATCSCKYIKGWGFPPIDGCYISEAAPEDKACRCSKYCEIFGIEEHCWCTGSVVPCEDNSSTYCKHPDTSLQSCEEGKGKYGNCGGYWRK